MALHAGGARPLRPAAMRTNARSASLRSASRRSACAASRRCGGPAVSTDRRCRSRRGAEIDDAHALGDVHHRVAKRRIDLEVALGALAVVRVHQAEHVVAGPRHSIRFARHVRSPSPRCAFATVGLRHQCGGFVTAIAGAVCSSSARNRVGQRIELLLQPLDDLPLLGDLARQFLDGLFLLGGADLQRRQSVGRHDHANPRRPCAGVAVLIRRSKLTSDAGICRE